MREMLTVGRYFPASGKNTIRKASDKYDDLHPVETVRMIYTSAVDDEGKHVDVLGVEELTVVGVARAPFTEIVMRHTERNHAFGEGLDETGLLDHLTDLYDVDDTSTPFLAIYFA